MNNVSLFPLELYPDRALPGVFISELAGSVSLSLHFLLPEKSKPSRGNNSDTSEKVPKIEVPGGESPFRQTINPLPAPLNPSLAAPRAWERQGKGNAGKDGIWAAQSAQGVPTSCCVSRGNSSAAIGKSFSLRLQGSFLFPFFSPLLLFFLPSPPLPSALIPRCWQVLKPWAKIGFFWGSF